MLRTLDGLDGMQGRLASICWIIQPNHIVEFSHMMC